MSANMENSKPKPTSDWSGSSTKRLTIGTLFLLLLAVFIFGFYTSDFQLSIQRTSFPARFLEVASNSQNASVLLPPPSLPLPVKRIENGDKYHMFFTRFLKGIRKEDYTCHSPATEDFKHSYTPTPALNCSSVIAPLDQKVRENRTRRQIHIWCEGGRAHSEVKTVPLTELPQSISDTASRSCLKLYIEQQCRDEYPVPNIVHYIYFGKTAVDFRRTIAMYSVFTIAKPCLVLLHGDQVTPGMYWDLLLQHGHNLVHVSKAPQTHINGRKIVAVANQADIARLEVLLEFGGVYLDTDNVIFQPIDLFRSVGFGAAFEGSGSTMSNSVMFARPNHEIIKIWLKHYNTYDGRNWNSHSTLYLTQLAREYPNLVQVFSSAFITFGFGQASLLYNKECSLNGAHGAHLYIRDYPKQADFNYIKKTRTTFARLARYIFFNNAQVCS